MGFTSDALLKFTASTANKSLPLFIFFSLFQHGNESGYQTAVLDLSSHTVTYKLVELGNSRPESKSPVWDFLSTNQLSAL